MFHTNYNRALLMLFDVSLPHKPVTSSSSQSPVSALPGNKRWRKHFLCSLADRQFTSCTLSARVALAMKYLINMLISHIDLNYAWNKLYGWNVATLTRCYLVLQTGSPLCQVSSQLGHHCCCMDTNKDNLLNRWFYLLFTMGRWTELTTNNGQSFLVNMRVCRKDLYIH